MLKTRLMVIAGMAAVVGIVSTLFLLRALKAQGADAPGGVPTSRVVVARVDMAIGTAVMPELLELASWPAASVPAGSFSSHGELAGRVTRSRIIAGEPIVASRLAPAGSRGGLPVLIADGMRAMSVAVNDIVGVAGFIQPGCRVDVIATVRGGNRQPVTKVILQNILVLAVAGDVEPGNNTRHSVTAITVAVDPAAAEKLSLAMNEGKIQLVLRNFVDGESVATPGTTPDELFRVARLASEERAEPPRSPEFKMVEVIRGLERSEVRLEVY